jgi:hypothetical protein
VKYSLAGRKTLNNQSINKPSTHQTPLSALFTCVVSRLSVFIVNGGSGQYLKTYKKREEITEHERGNR